MAATVKTKKKLCYLINSLNDIAEIQFDAYCPSRPSKPVQTLEIKQNQGWGHGFYSDQGVGIWLGVHKPKYDHRTPVLLPPLCSLELRLKFQYQN